MEIVSLGFRTDLMVLRSSGSEVIAAGDFIVVRTASNPTYWWGNFVLAPNAQAVDEAVQIFTQEFPRARHFAIGLDTDDGDIRGLGSLDMEAEVLTVLSARDLVAAAPVEAEIRELSSAHDWAQLLALWLDENPSAGVTYHQGRTDEAYRLAQTGMAAYLGAFRSGRLVSSTGIVTDGTPTARFQNVGTRQGHRRQGLASNLVVTAASIAKARWGVEQLVIVAEQKSSAHRLYRALGFDDTELQIQLSRI
ncbi:MAG TPA: GNAT family N-acetyltransferase [Acidimicrobiales bacterium]|nr:GNAT family N-acetyltransferase [Acidimicrobiales bacterium]